MIVKDFLKQRARRESWAEKQFQIKITKAIAQTIEPMFVAMRSDLKNVEQRIPNLFKPQHIEAALKWLYVDWGYSQFIWFANNQPFQKKEDFWKARLEELFKRFGAKKVTEILGTTLEMAKPAIKRALEMANEGSSIDAIEKEIRNQVQDVGGVMSKGRATTIARTEVISASNQSTFEAVRSAGVKTEKKWITGGLNIRPTHKAAEAQGWIPFDNSFRVGDYNMKYPGDFTGGPEEVINCKCTLIFRVID